MLYDALSFDKKTGRHEILDKAGIEKRFTGIGHDNLTGSAVFTDGQLEAAERLCVELGVSAAGAGAVIRTKARVEEPLHSDEPGADGAVCGVRYRDLSPDGDGELHDVRGTVILNVAGPWIDRVFRREAPGQPRLNGGTKGSHLIVDPFPGAPTDVVYYESQADGRLVLVIPWMGRYMLGTTDIRFEEDPDDARCDADEMTYILGEVNTLVPGANLTPDDVLYTFSGVRPLPYAPDKSESAVPRTHILHEHGAGLKGVVTVVGGKLTTYRQLAEDAVDDAFTRLGRKAPKTATKRLPFPGALDDPAPLRAELVAAGVPERTADRLLFLYGRRAADVVAEAGGDAELLEVFDEGTGAIGAELLFAVRREFAVTLADVFARRLLLAFEPDHALGSVDRAAALLGERLGWGDARRKEEIEGYRRWLDHLKVPAVSAATTPTGTNVEGSNPDWVEER